jgi:valyl-tRNA synthetase
MTELPKTFDPAEIEARWYAHWEEANAFRPQRPDAPPFTIVMPPPNVTGSLHIGHALDVTLQDILVRHARLQGKDALWVAGTDHAGIATQMVVERQMMERQERRSDFTREQFVEKVWDWKAESGGTITRQLRRLGASCDWKNERFTMDEGFSKAVIKVFVDLYNEGLLYRDKRLVNWDPGLKTAISDLEVETREVQGKFWHFRYPLADGAGHISVATTRPETMLADMAVAVNPDDDRYKDMKAKHIRLPLTGRMIPVVMDMHADPALGSGAVKITPGHDFNDFEVGLRAGFQAAEMYNMFDAEARVVQTADGLIPHDYIGLDRFVARARVVEAMDAAGLLERVEDRVIQTPYGDRSGVVIEPWLTDQWYVDAKTLAGPAIDAVRSGAIKVVPQSWEKTWFQWLENIQPWCVSRQLWWGHQIPAYFCPNPAQFGKKFSELPDGKILPDLLLVGPDHDDIRLQALTRYSSHGVSSSDIFIHDDIQAWAASVGDKPSNVHILRDQDVLDTWFSSALWPFGTLGWPEENNPSPLAGEGDSASAGRGEGDKGKPSTGALTPLTPLAGGESPSPAGGEGLSLLAKHYPNDVLISGFDILFFWDARMAMQGLHFMKEVPWKTLYLHGLVRAPDGSKMSKSKGNTVDPLGLIDKYGADALRFTLAAMESQGRDIKLDEKRVEGYRNFATKLWNAARFLQGNGVGASGKDTQPAAKAPVNKWIMGELSLARSGLDRAFEELRYDAMADAIYHFAWGTYCDWYIEFIKGAFDEETREVAAWVFDQILIMLHPFMPFITEEIWHSMRARGGRLLIHAEWPRWVPSVDAQSQDALRWVIEVVGAVRSAKNDMGIAPGMRLTAQAIDCGSIVPRYLEQFGGLLERVGRISISKGGELPEGPAIRISVFMATLVVPLDGAIDLDAERARLTKSAEAAEKETASLAGRLNNPAFVEKAKPEAVEKARADHAEKSAEAERLRAALARLG